MGKVISFQGADHKCGCSMITQCIAETIADRHKESKVLIVHPQSRMGTEYSPMVKESMERIRPYLADKTISVEELTEKTRWKNNIYVLGGLEKPGSQEYYSPEYTETLLLRAKDMFDFIFCDAGAELEHGISLGAMFNSDLRFLVLNQTETSLRRFEGIGLLYSKLNIKPDKYILNTYVSKGVYTKAMICERLNIKCDDIFTVKDSSFGSMAEYDGKSLLSYRDLNFKKNIWVIADYIEEFFQSFGSLQKEGC